MNYERLKFGCENVLFNMKRQDVFNRDATDKYLYQKVDDNMYNT